jgi:hypothetical protein
MACVRLILLRYVGRVRSGVVVVWRSGGRRRRPAISRLSVASVRLLTRLRGHVRRLLHRRAREGRRAVGLAHARLRVHSLDRDNASQGRVVGRLLELRLARLRTRVIGDEMKVLATGGGDAERLLHETVCLIAVSLGLSIILILVTTASRVWSFTTTSSVGREASASLALHLAVRQEASGNSTGAP